MNIFVITDTHFNHENIKKYENRPEDFNEIIIENWNKVVQSNDIVIHLGDIIFGEGKHEKLKDFMGRLNGRIILAIGNHDYKSWDFYFQNGFDFVCDYFVYRNVAFSHAPITPLPPQTQTNHSKPVDFNVHGHFHRGKHRSPENNPNYKDDYYDYQYWFNNRDAYINMQIEDELRPFTLEEVLVRKNVEFAKVKSDGREERGHH